MCIKIHELDPPCFCTAPCLACEAALKKTKVRLDLLTDIDVLLKVEKGIREGICHSIYQYAKADNKYMKDYDKNKKWSYLKYQDENNSYGWAIWKKLPVNNFEWIEDSSQFNENFIKNYNEESDEGYFLEVDVEFPERLQNLHDDLPFFPERIKIEKVDKLAANLHDKILLHHGLVLKKVHRVIKLNQNAWLKSYIYMNTDLREKAKNDFEKDLFKFISNGVFEKTM